MVFVFLLLSLLITNIDAKKFDMGCECGKRPNNAEIEKECEESASLEDHQD